MADLEQDRGNTMTVTPERLEALAKLARLDINSLEPEDFRQLISQRLMLEVLVAPALRILTQNPMTCASLYPGDLLEAMKAVPDEFWTTRQTMRREWNRIRSQHNCNDD